MGFSMRLSGIVLAACVPLAAGVTPAGAGAIQLDPDNTQITFTLGATLHTVHGTARVRHGEIVYDPATGAVSGEVVVDGGSLQTGNTRRDRTMHEDVLETAKYPDIRFTPQRAKGTFNPTGESDLELSGTFDLHGSRHDIIVPVHVKAEGDRLSVTARLTIPYVAWGLKDPSFAVLRVEKQVSIEVAFAGPLKNP